MDLARLSQYFTLDILIDIALGFPFGLLAVDGDYVESLDSEMG
jgi:hypothetical protein